MNIGFIGLGSMGRPISLCLVRAGHHLSVHDIDRDGTGARELRQAGANWADTPRAAAQDAAITFTSLPGPPEIESVALGDDGILDGAAKGSVYIDLSTNAPVLIRRIHATFKDHGVEVLDAPVSEGTDEAKHEGTLTVMVGGDEPVFERVKPVLDAIGRDNLFYVGPSGSGAVCKLVNNVLVYANHATVAEALTLGRLAGVSYERLAAVIRRSTGQSLVSDGALHSLNNPDAVGAGFPLWVGRKDMRLATDLGRELDMPLDFANHTEQRLTAWMARGCPTKPITVRVMIEELLSGRADTAHEGNGP